jgi:hypothetical protein
MGSTMAGPGNNPVQGLRTLPDLHWEFLRLWTGFELSSSWRRLPCYGADLNRNILDLMRWPHIGLGAQDLNDMTSPAALNGHISVRPSSDRCDICPGAAE